MNIQKKGILFSLGLSIGMMGIALGIEKFHWPKSLLYAFMGLVPMTWGYFVFKKISQPLSQLLEGIRIFSSGHFDYPIEFNSKNEIGELSRAVAHLAEELTHANKTIDLLSKEKEHLKVVENELEEKKEYYHRLFEYSNDAVFIYDFEGRILEVNAKACQMLGYTRKELLRIPFLELQTEEELEKCKAAIRTGTKTGSIRYESVFRRKDGQTIDVEISSSIVEIKKGIMQSIVSNITERKEMERSLRESEEKFRTFMETASDLMYITDANGILTYVNDAMVHTLGFTKEELIGMPFQDLLYKESIESSKALRQEWLELGEDVHPLILESKNRRKIYGEMKAVAIYDTQGKFQGIRGVFRDMTERRKIEQSQRLAELGQLAADMAHEVNNHIMIIQTRGKIAQLRKPDDPEWKNDLEIILNQCAQTQDIVKRLLLFSKPSRGEFKEVNIHDVLNLVIGLVEEQFRHHHVHIEKHFHPRLPFIQADEKQMQEVFINLLRNAYEAMPEGGVITIRTLPRRDEIHIHVTDTGCGISENDLKQIFNPFFTTKENGTGLGLSVCYGIIKAHKGDLRYTSKLGEGTTATVILPVKAG